MLRKSIPLLIASITLASCQTSSNMSDAELAKLIEKKKAVCAAYGFPAGSPIMAECVRQEIAKYDAETIDRRERVAAGMQAMGNSMRANRPRYTNCNRFGNSLSCTTY